MSPLEGPGCAAAPHCPKRTALGAWPADAAAEARALPDAAPGFAAAARDECRIWTMSEAFIDKLTEGWRKAGLPVA